MTVLGFLEWTWTVVHLLGLIFVLMLMLDALRDVRAVSPAMLARFGLTNGRREIYAIMYMRGRLLTLLVHVPSLIVGVASLIEPDPPEVSASRYLSAFVFILFAVLVDGLTVLDLRDRMRIRRYAAQTP